jgi:UDP-2,3-diacylglucosamine hydrolase
MACTLFISDLHLDRERPAAIRLFQDFLDAHARRAAAVYILGDLFEAWVGDEDIGRYREVIDALRACTDTGTRIFYMPGNRDFLVGPQFSAATGCTLLEDPRCIDLYGEPVLLTHGDALCTDDAEYQAFRSRLRDTRWQRDFLEKPLDERRRIVAGFRDASRAQGRLKPPADLDVSEQAVSRLMSRHRVACLVHGHTHRQAAHALTVDGRPARRLVLGNWDSAGSLLECTPCGCRFRSFTAPGAQPAA